MWSSFKFEPFKDESFDYVAKYGSDVFTQGVVRVTPSECVLPAAYMEIAMRIRNFIVYDDDVWVVSFPKCGSTWTREIVWLIMNNMDFETAKEVDLVDRFPCIEFNSIRLSIPQVGHAVELCGNLKRPRFIKSHLPVELLPEQLWSVKPKIIYVSRNPKDTAVSLYHHYKLTSHYSGSMEGFMDAFLGHVIFYSPYWKHVIGFWKMRKEPHVLVNTVEEMKMDLPSVIKKLADFLGRKLTDEQVKVLIDFLELYVPLRKGTLSDAAELEDKVEGWGRGMCEERLSEELQERFDRWTQEALHGTEYI